ncbi:MAG TPA: TonB-dependent receptor [Blastocatellia bacterium]|nr:TonB-dependent receptor [Blastocatellia bacterium]
MEYVSRAFSNPRPYGSIINRIRIANIVIAVAITLATSTGLFAQQQQSSKDLTDKSLDELMSVQVTSVSKKEQSLFTTPAAVYVISQEDIRRSGSSTIADVLRIVPGLDVARVNTNTWAITARGFNGRFSNKMLVLIDGRSVYTQEFSGVYWELQDMILEDIERIEVIRGPGATIWGANAVNGVINIITKRASSTQGGLVTARSGNEDQAIGGIRYGGKIGDSLYYRAYTQYSDRTGQIIPSSLTAEGPWHMLRGGFRVDWRVSDRDSLTLQADIYKSNSENVGPSLTSVTSPLQIVNQPVQSSGGNVRVQWDRVVSAKSDFKLSFYVDRTKRNDSKVDDGLYTINFDFSHHLALGNRNDIVWGAGYKYTTDNIVGSFDVVFLPKKLAEHFANAFVQDEITVVENRLHLTLGTKFERDGFTGYSWQPSAKIAWTPSNKQTVWAAVSGADRLPSRNSRDILVHLNTIPLPGNKIGLLTLNGNPDAVAERLVAYEAGYRVQATAKLSLDIASFYNVYNRLSTTEPLQPFFEANPFPPHLVIPLQYGNKMSGDTYGAEVSANWNATTWWKLSAGYSWLRMQMHPDPTSKDTTTAPKTEGSDPHHQIQLQSYLTLPHRFDLDASLNYVDKLAGQNTPSYVRIDLRLGLRLSESFEASVGVQNMLDSMHREFGDVEAINSALIKRSAYGKLTWRF